MHRLTIDAVMDHAARHVEITGRAVNRVTCGRGAYEALVSDAEGSLCGYRETTPVTGLNVHLPGSGMTPVVMVPELPDDYILLESNPAQTENGDDE